jgi:hypothetical protein
MSACCVKIAKVNTKSLKHIDKALAAAGGTSVATMKKAEAQDEKDLEMLQSEGEIIYATERKSCKSICLTTMLNKFG